MTPKGQSVFLGEGEGQRRTLFSSAGSSVSPDQRRTRVIYRGFSFRPIPAAIICDFGCMGGVLRGGEGFPHNLRNRSSSDQSAVAVAVASLGAIKNPGESYQRFAGAFNWTMLV